MLLSMIFDPEIVQTPMPASPSASKPLPDEVEWASSGCRAQEMNFAMIRELQDLE